MTFFIVNQTQPTVIGTVGVLNSVRLQFNEQITLLPIDPFAWASVGNEVYNPAGSLFGMATVTHEGTGILRYDFTPDSAGVWTVWTLVELHGIGEGSQVFKLNVPVQTAARPVLNKLTNLGTGSSIQVTLTPPLGAERTDIYYRDINSNTKIFAYGANYTGAPGVAGTVNLTSLTDNTLYEVMLVDRAGQYITSAGAGCKRIYCSSTGLALDRRIIDELKQTLQAISIANGFNYDVQRVEEKATVATPDLKETPTIFLFQNTEMNDNIPLVMQSKHLTVAVVGYVRQFSNMDREVNKLKADIETAVLADRTRGGLAVNTVISGPVTLFYGADVAPWGYVQFKFEIYYRHYYGNPYRRL